jgi:hypothetical protein
MHCIPILERFVVECQEGHHRRDPRGQPRAPKVLQYDWLRQHSDYQQEIDAHAPPQKHPTLAERLTAGTRRKICAQLQQRQHIREKMFHPPQLALKRSVRKQRIEKFNLQIESN